MAKIGECFCLIRNGANIKQGEDNSGYPITRIETISNRIVDRGRMGFAGITDVQKYQDYILSTLALLFSQKYLNIQHPQYMKLPLTQHI